MVKTAESMAIDVMRLLALASHREEIRRIAISVHPSVAAYLSNRKRKQIAKLEAECNMVIQIGFDPNAPAEHLKIECFDANGNEVRMIPDRPRIITNAGIDPRERSTPAASYPVRTVSGPAGDDRLTIASTVVVTAFRGICAMTFQPAPVIPLHRPRRLRGHPGCASSSVRRVLPSTT